MRAFIFASLFPIAAACAGEPGKTSSEQVMSNPSCSILKSENWSAWINAMPGPDRSDRLIIVGDVTLPTPGYDIQFIAGSADRSATPVQHLILKTSPPVGFVPQVLTTQKIRYEGPAISSKYRGILILCGDQVLANIASVEKVY